MPRKSAEALDVLTDGGPMSDEEKPESLRRKILLLVFDKVALALVIAFVGYLFSQALQKQQMITEYQKSLFEKRLTAYEELLKSAKAARDQCAGFYISNAKSGEETWRRKFHAIESRAFVLQHGPSESSGGDIGSESYESVSKALQKVEDTRRENGLYISESVSRKVDEFLNTILQDLDATLRQAEKKQPYDRNFEDAASSRSNQAYEDLRRTIMESLRLKEIILG
jgi:hypothetical protein